MKDSQELENLLQVIFEKGSLHLASLSSPLIEGETSKVSIRPIHTKGRINYQITEQRGQKSSAQ